MWKLGGLWCGTISLACLTRRDIYIYGGRGPSGGRWVVQNRDDTDRLVRVEKKRRRLYIDRLCIRVLGMGEQVSDTITTNRWEIRTKGGKYYFYVKV